jgi:CBS domain containing-hemolysin-like protein
MTPRVVVSALQVDRSVDQALAGNPTGRQFSRLPVYESSIDAVTGFVLLEDLLVAKSKGRGEAKVGEFRRDIIALPGSMVLSKLLETLLEERQHIALVVGEFGETLGIVTLEDVVEILDEGDDVADMQQLARQLWVKRARRLGLPEDLLDS